MALNINTNIAALRARNQLNKTSQSLQKSLERLSSGLRINWAADDAAGLAIADGLKMTATGLGQAIRNANEGISLIKVADGALIEYGNILNTLKEKVTQAANATQNAETRKSIQRDINKLLTELNNIARTTEFNGQKLLSGSFVNKKFQIGSASYVTASLSIRSAETNAVGGTKTAIMNLNTIGPMQLTITNAASGLSVTTETIELNYNNNPANGAGALANEINRYSGVTGVTAVAVVESQSDVIQAGTISGLKINGVDIGDITVQAADADGALVSAINAKSLQTGVEATVTEDGKLVLNSVDGRAIKVEADSGLSTVLGKSGQDLSTLGHIRLIQKGVADFQIKGAGGLGIGANIELNGDVTLDDDSVLAAGSTILSGSTLKAGSLVGGDLTISGASTTTQVTLVKAGSTLKTGSIIAEGTQITGDITVSEASLNSDMLVKAGSQLKAGTTIGAGTVVYGTLAEALNVADGTVIGDGGAVLANDVTLNTDIVLKYSSVTNTQIASGSKIAAGSILGADFEITADATFNADMELLAGSTIADGSTLKAGSIIGGDVTVATGATINTTQESRLVQGSTLKAGSVLAQGSVINDADEVEVASDTTLNQDTVIGAGSKLITGTKLAAGTVVNQDMYLSTAEFTYDSNDTRWELNTGDGSVVKVTAGTVLEQDMYVVGTNYTLDTVNSQYVVSTSSDEVTLTNDMVLKAGSMLNTDTSAGINSSVVLKSTGEIGQVETKKLSDINVLTYEGAQVALTIVDAAIADIDGIRAELGSAQNQLQSTVANISVTQVNLKAAEAGIREVDFSAESSNFSKMQVLMQAGMFALAQSNTIPQMAVQLLQGR
ncbi:flagellin domain protein [Thermodesulfatator indicus DSM 15286]|uniref:Flagellin n=1 Tax=Thermodesulfatator indicus (strain DSM 15286 / JCM 11887 / CIR29812) TaxID=667014 RepID=F8AAQ7_THEID|nr:flagellin [Thermodesulfatator indicus]AEH44333.1 flagellin domain protein [Thermodesulfatator indicus DSM 15286]